MMRVSWLAASILLWANLGCGPSFELGRFAQGKVRKNEFEKWFFYERGEEMQYTENGSCVVNGVSKPCMWHGFMFEYRTDADEVSLDCVVRHNQLVTEVNPREIVSESTEESSFTLTLPGSETLLRHKQYTVGSVFSGEVSETRTVCKLHGRWPGRTVLKFDTVIRFGPPSAQTL